MITGKMYPTELTRAETAFTLQHSAFQWHCISLVYVPTWQICPLFPDVSNTPGGYVCFSEKGHTNEVSLEKVLSLKFEN